MNVKWWRSGDCECRWAMNDCLLIQAHHIFWEYRPHWTTSRTTPIFWPQATGIYRIYHRLLNDGSISRIPHFLGKIFECSKCGLYSGKYGNVNQNTTQTRLPLPPPPRPPPPPPRSPSPPYPACRQWARHLLLVYFEFVVVCYYRKIPPECPISPICPSLPSCQQGCDWLYPRMTLSQSVMPYCTADACSTPLEVYATVPTLLTRDRTNPAFCRVCTTPGSWPLVGVRDARTVFVGWVLSHAALNAASRTRPSAPPHLKRRGGRGALAGFYGTRRYPTYKSNLQLSTTTSVYHDPRHTSVCAGLVKYQYCALTGSVLRRTPDYLYHNHSSAVLLCQDAKSSILSFTAFNFGGCASSIVNRNIIAWVGDQSVRGKFLDTHFSWYWPNAVTRYAVCEASKYIVV